MTNLSRRVFCGLGFGSLLGMGVGAKAIASEKPQIVPPERPDEVAALAEGMVGTWTHPLEQPKTAIWKGASHGWEIAAFECQQSSDGQMWRLYAVHPSGKSLCGFSNSISSAQEKLLSLRDLIRDGGDGFTKSVVNTSFWDGKHLYREVMRIKKSNSVPWISWKTGRRMPPDFWFPEKCKEFVPDKGQFTV